MAEVHAKKPPSKIAVIALLGLGVWLAVELGLGDTFHWQQLIAAIVAGVLVLLPGVRDVIRLAFASLRQLSARGKHFATLIIFVLSAAYLLGTAVSQGRALYPKAHDGQVHTLQTLMLAHGHLWLPQHPLADFFETFFVIVKPVYAPMYFPGTALVNVPGVWLHWPVWVIPWLISALGVALTFRLGAELIDAPSGIVMALLVVANGKFRLLNFDIMSHPLTLVLGCWMLLVWMRWLRTKSVREIAILGAIAGLAVIVRPDGLCYAIPVAVAVLIDLRKLRLSRRASIISIGLACAAPFLALQLVFDHGVTGHWFETPYAFYLKQFQPGAEPGFSKFDPNAKPQTQLVQKQSYFYRKFVPVIKPHRMSNMLKTWFTDRGYIMWRVIYSPLPILTMLIPLAILGLRDRRRFVAIAVIPLMFVLYGSNPLFLSHYPDGFLAPLTLLLLIAIEQVLLLLPRARDFVMLALIALCIAQLPEFSGERDEWNAPTMQWVHDEMPRQVEKPAVVLFAYRDDFSSPIPLTNFNEEPVYNTDVLNPDDAPIIKAHDLGPAKDREIFEYYAKRQPNRVFYRYDRVDRKLTRLGTAAELAGRLGTTSRQSG